MDKVTRKIEENPRAQPGSGLPCIICGKPTTGKVDISVNIFRGDDDQVRVCNEHQKGSPKPIIAAYLARGDSSDG